MAETGKYECKENVVDGDKSDSLYEDELLEIKYEIVKVTSVLISSMRIILNNKL